MAESSEWSLRTQGRLRNTGQGAHLGRVKSWTYREQVAPGTSGGQALLVSSLKVSPWGVKELLLTKNIDASNFFYTESSKANLGK